MATLTAYSATPSGAPAGRALRILAAVDVWEGSNGYAYVKAFRRLGHSVRVVSADTFVPDWTGSALRVLRRALRPLLVRDYNEALKALAAEFRPDLLFVFKGRNVTAATIENIRSSGAVAVNIYPDVSFLAHGPYLPRALQTYNWIFQTKRFGIADLAHHLGIRCVSYLPHAFDPEVHRPVPLDHRDLQIYACDVSFVGTWSPKKQRLIENLARALPSMTIKIWGAQWDAARATLGSRVQGRGVLGTEYAKAVAASGVNLAMLSEIRRGASSGDQITSRTFHIPAIGGFMLHERTSEFLEYFEEDRECACFASADEIVARVRHYLPLAGERQTIASAGRARVLRDGHSVDARAQVVLARVAALQESP